MIKVLQNKVLQFKITLKDSDPAIWRRIQIPDEYTFYQLHTAIQEAMGWKNHHLYEFKLQLINADKNNKDTLRIGFLFNDGAFENELPLLDDKKNKVSDYIESHQKMLYTYDFGENWEHVIEFEGSFSRAADTQYPLCIDGQQACPPENVGGYHGYLNFIEAMKDKEHPHHEMYARWRDSEPFDPNQFDPSKVIFSLPFI